MTADNSPPEVPVKHDVADSLLWAEDGVAPFNPDLVPEGLKVEVAGTKRGAQANKRPGVAPAAQAPAQKPRLRASAAQATAPKQLAVPAALLRVCRLVYSFCDYYLDCGHAVSAWLSAG